MVVNDKMVTRAADSVVCFMILLGCNKKYKITEAFVAEHRQVFCCVRKDGDKKDPDKCGLVQNRLNRRLMSPLIVSLYACTPGFGSYRITDRNPTIIEGESGETFNDVV